MCSLSPGQGAVRADIKDIKGPERLQTYQKTTCPVSPSYWSWPSITHPPSSPAGGDGSFSLDGSSEVGTSETRTQPLCSGLVAGGRTSTHPPRRIPCPKWSLPRPGAAAGGPGQSTGAHAPGRMASLLWAQLEWSLAPRRRRPTAAPRGERSTASSQTRLQHTHGVWGFGRTSLTCEQCPPPRF